jgi:hypothetical protein
MNNQVFHALIEEQLPEDAVRMVAECGFQSADEMVTFIWQNEAQITEAIAEGSSFAEAMIEVSAQQQPYQAEDLGGLRANDRSAILVAHSLLSTLHTDRAVGDTYVFEEFRDGDGNVTGHDIRLKSDDSRVFQARYSVDSPGNGEPSKIQQVQVQTPFRDQHIEAVLALKEKLNPMQMPEPLKQTPNQKTEGGR